MSISGTKADLPVLTPHEVAEALQEGRILLVDVREPLEYASDRIHGALLMPLSTFDPSALPHDAARPVVLQCGSGKRSATAFEKCRAAGVSIAAHMDGGIAAWKAAGLPTVSVDPASGSVRDRK